METLNLKRYKTTHSTECKLCGEKFMLLSDQPMHDYSIRIWKRFESISHYENCIGVKRNVWIDEA